jgi:hypothetical protein
MFPDLVTCPSSRRFAQPPRSSLENNAPIHHNNLTRIKKTVSSKKIDKPDRNLPGFYLINARSLLPKVDALSLLLNTHALQVVALAYGPNFVGVGGGGGHSIVCPKTQTEQH